MNKGDLVEKIANDADISKASADRALSAAIDAIIKAGQVRRFASKIGPKRLPGEILKISI